MTVVADGPGPLNARSTNNAPGAVGLPVVAATPIRGTHETMMATRTKAPAQQPAPMPLTDASFWLAARPARDRCDDGRAWQGRVPAPEVPALGGTEVEGTPVRLAHDVCRAVGHISRRRRA